MSSEPLYLISVVAKMLRIHPQTLRQYEREGLITPSRTDGKMRLYSQNDVARVEMILRLTRDLGVNLAGVDVILSLKQQIEELKQQVLELRAKGAGTAISTTVTGGAGSAESAGFAGAGGSASGRGGGGAGSAGSAADRGGAKNFGGNAIDTGGPVPKTSPNTALIKRTQKFEIVIFDEE